MKEPNPKHQWLVTRTHYTQTTPLYFMGPCLLIYPVPVGILSLVVNNVNGRGRLDDIDDRGDGPG